MLSRERMLEGSEDEKARQPDCPDGWDWQRLGRRQRHGRTMGKQHWMCFTSGWGAGAERRELCSEGVGRERQSWQEMAWGGFTDCWSLGSD